MPFTLPVLPYPLDALDPVIDKRTMEIHYGKHHQTYVNNLNKALEPFPDLQKLTLVQLLANKAAAVPQPARQGIINQGGGHFNHAMFWQMLGPKGSGEPTGPVGDAIKSTFGSFATLKEKMIDCGLKQFGSGWAWLVKKPDGTLAVYSTLNQDTPHSVGDTALLTLDVWEHAYYLQYQNRRNEFLSAIWNIVNWADVNRRFAGQ
jgi:superoxide dismutase, Fe-Mn family